MEEARKREAKIAEHEKNVNVIDYIKDSRQMNRDFETQRARNKSQADIAHQVRAASHAIATPLPTLPKLVDSFLSLVLVLASRDLGLYMYLPPLGFADQGIEGFGGEARGA